MELSVSNILWNSGSVRCDGLAADIDSLVFNDAPEVSEAKRALVHAKLSQAIADRLKMQPVSDLLRYGGLGISDICRGRV